MGHLMFLALSHQRRVISAIVLREAQTRYGKSSLGYLWAFIEPVTHVAVMSFVYWAINRQSPVGASVLVFFVTGVLPFFLFQKVALHLGNAVRANRLILRLPAVTPFDVVAARAILEGLTWITVATLLFAALIAAGRARPPDQVMVCAAAAFVTFSLGCGVGLMNSVAMTIWPSWARAYPTLTRPLYHFSAIFFFIDHIPPHLRWWLSWNPLVHAVQWFRVGYYSEYASLVLDREYLIKWAIATLVIGLCLERIAQRKLVMA